VLCFLDDILIFSRTEDEHLAHLRTVIQRLHDQELYVKPSKCSFMQREVSFLGHRIGADGLRVAPDKVGAVQQWPTPTSVTEVRSFLGLANFYRRFVKDYSRIALPLTELTKDTTAWSWGEEQQRAFAALKAALCAPPVLLVPDQKMPFVLNCDACDFAIGATLQQDQGNGLQPVAYFSAKMTDAERNYDVREKEFMALMRACKHWRHYLHGIAPFTLLTDHDSLRYHKSMPHLSGRLARWVEAMAEFDYKLAHIPGKDNVVADALSRRADYAVPKQNRVAALAAVRAPRVPRPPEPAEQRQRNIDAATKVLPAQNGALLPNKQGTVMTPSQRCSADTSAGVQCGQRTAIAHLCWNHLQRDMGVRVKRSGVAGAGRGLFVAREGGLPADHRIPYTGDEIRLTRDSAGGAYVLETRRGTGIDAARRNCGVGRWVNDPRGSRDDNGRPRRANCDFVVHTPAGGDQRVAAVRTLRPVEKGEELFVQYGNAYWRYQAPKKRAAVKRSARTKRQTKHPRPERRQRDRAVPQSRQRDQHFERVLMATLASTDTPPQQPAVSRPPPAPTDTTPAQPVTATRSLRPTAARLAAQAERTKTAPQPPVSAATGTNDSTTASSSQTERAARPDTPSTLMDEARQAAAADSEYQQLIQQPPSGARVNRDLLYSDTGVLYVPTGDRLRTRVLAEMHDSTTGGHCGRDRMLAEMQKRFAWRGMASDVEQYVATCGPCQLNKHSKQLKPGLMMPLPLPEEPCMHWTTDAVSGLPKSKRGHDAIQVFVDRLTKLKRFAVARTTDDSAALANTTLRTIIGPHGMPKSLVSDRDPRITARYWRELSRVLGSEVNLSTAYHPQSDGQSEREIQTLVTALRAYVNAMGNDWDDYLPALELAFNSKQQASTGAAPFTLVYGVDARLPIDCVMDGEKPATVPAVQQRAERMRTAIDHARSKAEQAQANQKRQADRHRRLLQLKDGDRVLLSTEHLQLRSGTHKLTGRFIGPFRVTGAVNDNAIKLDLPPLLKALHSTFNISRLKLYRDSQDRFPDRPQRVNQPPAVDCDTNGVTSYEVESIMAQRGPGARREMLVRWQGYGAEHDEWVPRSELVLSAPQRVADFDATSQGHTAHNSHTHP
jgi:hypothetical protein